MHNHTGIITADSRLVVLVHYRIEILSVDRLQRKNSIVINANADK